MKNSIIAASTRIFYFTSAFVILAELMVINGKATVNFAQMPAFWLMLISAAAFILVADKPIEQSGLDKAIRIFKFLFTNKSVKATVK